jgi:hypothetical protein
MTRKSTPPEPVRTHHTGRTGFSQGRAVGMTTYMNIDKVAGGYGCAETRVL